MSYISWILISFEQYEKMLECNVVELKKKKLHFVFWFGPLKFVFMSALWLALSVMDTSQAIDIFMV